MTIGNINYRLTKHGRKRFLSRVGEMTDNEIILTAAKGLPGFKFVWRPDAKDPHGLRLVTVLIVKQ